MADLTPTQQRAIEDVLLVARVFEGQGEDRLYHHCKTGKGAGDNHGQLVEWFLATVGLPPELPWCMAFAMTAGVRALGRKSSVAARWWPLPLTGGCQWLFDWATHQQAAGAISTLLYDVPQVGDLFLLYEGSVQRYGHTGFVTGVSGAQVTTIEGNTNQDGSRDGWAVFQKTRAITGMKFVRWAALLS